MRKIEFRAPQKIMADFANEITSRDLANSIIGSTEDKKVIIEVEYEKDETELIDELEEKFEELTED